MFAKTRNLQYIFFILLLVLTSAIFINPTRNILFNDDFAYAWSVKDLVEKNILIISDWTSAALVFQVFWGAIFCLPFGFSFAAVNISTIVLSAIGLIAFFSILGEFDFTLRRRFASVAILFTSPLYFDFSFSFMTDVPYTAMMLVSLYFFVRAIKEEKKILWIIGSVVIALAFLIRQIAISVIGGLLLFLLVEAIQTKNFSWRKCAWALSPAACIITVYFLWLNFIHGPTWCQSNIAWKWALVQISNFEQYVQVVTKRFFLFSNLIAVFLLPFILPFFKGFNKVLKPLRDNKFISVTCLGLIGGYAAIMIASGDGLLIGRVFIESVLFVNIPPWLWKCFFFLGSLCVAAWCAYGLIWLKANLWGWFRGESSSRMDPRYRFLLYAFFFHFFLSIGHTFTWDYYCIPILPFMLIFLNRIFRMVKFQFPLAMVLVAGMLVVSLFNTRFRYDYSELVWREGNAMIASGIKPESIHATLSFKGWYNNKHSFTPLTDKSGRNNADRFSWVRPGNCVFFFSPIAKTRNGKVIRKKVVYHSFGLERTLYILKEQDSS